MGEGGYQRRTGGEYQGAGATVLRGQAGAKGGAVRTLATYGYEYGFEVGGQGWDTEAEAEADVGRQRGNL